MKNIILYSFILLLTTNIFAQQKYDVAAYVWPAYYPDERAQIFWPDGIGEWQTVISNKPKFDGHKQPRYPLWGYVNEADPYVMEMQIDAATRHGVNVFIYDWYWFDGMPFLEGCLNDGFLKAPNNEEMKFYLMWANHDVNMNWNKPLASITKNPLLWKGSVSREEFEKLCKRVIEKYFSLPNYYKVNGKPSFMIYDLNLLIQGFGSVQKTKEALDWFRDEVKRAGFKGLDLQLTLRANMQGNVSAVSSDKEATQLSAIKDLAFDGATHYQYCHFIGMDGDYLDKVAFAESTRDALDKELPCPYYPHVSVGWDTNPRFEMIIPGIVDNNTPENFEKALLGAKKYVDNHPNQAPLVIINSWNEWTETSYLQPCTMFGYGYLEAAKAVFRPDFSLESRNPFIIECVGSGNLFWADNGRYRKSKKNGKNVSDYAFMIENAGEGFVRIKSLKTKAYLSADLSVSDKNGTFIVDKEKSNSKSQLWKIEYNGLGVYKIVNGQTGRIISESGENDNVHLWDNGNSNLQKWILKNIEL